MTQPSSRSLAAHRPVDGDRLTNFLFGFLMAAGLVFLFLGPTTSVQAQKATNTSTTKATNSMVQKKKAEIKKHKKEVEKLKQEDAETVKKNAAPKIQQQGAGQNIGGTTEKIDLLDNPKSK